MVYIVYEASGLLAVCCSCVDAVVGEPHSTEISVRQRVRVTIETHNQL